MAKRQKEGKGRDKTSMTVLLPDLIWALKLLANVNPKYLCFLKSTGKVLTISCENTAPGRCATASVTMPAHQHGAAFEATVDMKPLLKDLRKVKGESGLLTVEVRGDSIFFTPFKDKPITAKISKALPADHEFDVLGSVVVDPNALMSFLTWGKDVNRSESPHAWMAWFNGYLILTNGGLAQVEPWPVEFSQQTFDIELFHALRMALEHVDVTKVTQTSLSTGVSYCVERSNGVTVNLEAWPNTAPDFEKVATALTLQDTLQRTFWVPRQHFVGILTAIERDAPPKTKGVIALNLTGDILRFRSVREPDEGSTFGIGGRLQVSRTNDVTEPIEWEGFAHCLLSILSGMTDDWVHVTLATSLGDDKKAPQPLKLAVGNRFGVSMPNAAPFSGTQPGWADAL